MYYMGIVRLPAKDDYWSTERIMPSHPLLDSLPHARFKYIWRNLHLMGPSTGDETVDADDANAEEAEPHMREPESPLSDDSDDDGDDEQTVEEVDEDAEYSETWFEKVRVLIDHVRETSLKLLLRPGLAVCIDEMMIKFEGRSAEMHCMKNKPIDEVYKWFVLADSKTGYVCWFTPDGRVGVRTRRKLVQQSQQARWKDVLHDDVPCKESSWSSSRSET
eukprot:IDg23663t1